MALPKISHPIFDLTIPSTKKKAKFRPMLVKEEKILLMAKTSDDTKDVLSAIKQVVHNCMISEGIDVDKLSLFDVEYLFIKLRAFSVSNITTVSYRDNEDDQIYTFNIDLNDIAVTFPPGIDTNIKVTDNLMVTMKYAEASLYDDEEFSKVNPDNFFDELVIRCIDKFYDGDNVIDPSTIPREELEEYLQTFNTQTYDKLRNFVMNTPHLFYEIKYKNSMDTDRRIVLTSLTDFFTLR